MEEACIKQAFFILGLLINQPNVIYQHNDQLSD